MYGMRSSEQSVTNVTENNQLSSAQPFMAIHIVTALAALPWTLSSTPP